MAYSGVTTHQGGRIQTTVVCNLDALKPHENEWNELAYQSAPKIPSCSYAWIVSYFEHFLKSNQSFCVVFAYEDGVLLGVLPLVVTSQIPGIQYLNTPWNGDLYSASPIVSVNHAETVFDTLLECAWRTYPSAVWIEMSDIPVNAGCSSFFQGYTNLIIKNRNGRYLTVNTDQDEFQASLSKNFRSNQKKATNKLNKLSNVETVYIKGADASSAQLSEFTMVEASGWKGRVGTAIEKIPELVSFYQTLTDRLSTAGWLEWHFLRADDTTIAGHMAIRFNRSMILWKLGYHEEYKRCSPGNNLLQSLLDQAFADPDLDEINMLSDEAFYDNWNMQKREHYRVRLYRGKRIRSLLLGYIPNAIVYVPLRNQKIRSFFRSCLQHIRNILGKK